MIVRLSGKGIASLRDVCGASDSDAAVLGRVTLLDLSDNSIAALVAAPRGPEGGSDGAAALGVDAAGALRASPVLSAFAALHTLRLSQNRLASLRGLSAVAGTLTDADFSGNCLTSCAGLGPCSLLQRIDLSRNALTAVDEFPVPALSVPSLVVAVSSNDLRTIAGGPLHCAAVARVLTRLAVDGNRALPTAEVALVAGDCPRLELLTVGAAVVPAVPGGSPRSLLRPLLRPPNAVVAVVGDAAAEATADPSNTQPPAAARTSAPAVAPARVAAPPPPPVAATEAAAVPPPRGRPALRTDTEPLAAATLRRAAPPAAPFDDGVPSAVPAPALPQPFARSGSAQSSASAASRGAAASSAAGSSDAAAAYFRAHGSSFRSASAASRASSYAATADAADRAAAAVAVGAALSAPELLRLLTLERADTARLGAERRALKAELRAARAVAVDAAASMRALKAENDALRVAAHDSAQRLARQASSRKAAATRLAGAEDAAAEHAARSVCFARAAAALESHSGGTAREVSELRGLVAALREHVLSLTAENDDLVRRLERQNAAAAAAASAAAAEDGADLSFA